MNRLLDIATSAAPGSGVQHRKLKYGANNVHDFLRDIISLANASIDGPRYIVIGCDFDNRGRKTLHDVGNDDFSGKPPYQSLANEFIEPALRIHYKPVSSDGKQLGVFEIADCQDRPYMMRIDHSEHLRRGDAYMRVNQSNIKMGRRQLQDLFEKKFRDSISAGDIEVGFPGDIIHKQLSVAHSNLSDLPSTAAKEKLRQLIKIQSESRETGSTSVMARMIHARLYGTDDPYVSRSTDELMQELNQIQDSYNDHDEHFLFEQRTNLVQMVICNQGKEPIVDASLSLLMPNRAGFHVAIRPPRTPVKNGFVDRSPDEIASYPSVIVQDDVVQVSSKIGDIQVGEPVNAFSSPLRISCSDNLQGLRFAIRYSLHGQNLRSPAKGRLRLLFQGEIGLGK